jgi:hypothetical protein
MLGGTSERVPLLRLPAAVRAANQNPTSLPPTQYSGDVLSSGYDPLASTKVKLKSWDGELTERQVEDYTFVAIEALCALGEVGSSRTALDIFEMAKTLHPEVVIDSGVLKRVLELGLVKGRFERATDLPDGFSIHRKLHSSIGTNKKYVDFLLKIADAAQQKGLEAKMRARSGERSAYANMGDIVPFGRIAIPKTQEQRAPVGNPFRSASAGVDPMLADARMRRLATAPRLERPAVVEDPRTRNPPSARSRDPTILAGGSDPAFVMTLPSFESSGLPPSGDSHFAVQTETRELRAPRLETGGVGRFAQQYTLGGVGGIRDPTQLLSQRALDATDIANLSARHLNASPQPKADSCTRIIF